MGLITQQQAGKKNKQFVKSQKREPNPTPTAPPPKLSLSFAFLYTQIKNNKLVYGNLSEDVTKEK